MNTEKLPILTVVEVNDLPRFVIQDEAGRVWTGEKFDSRNGTLFARHNEAATTAQDILKQTFNGGQTFKYCVPLFVEVHSHGPVNVTKIAQYLSAASKLFLNTTEFGNGPENTLVLPRIEWSRIERMKEFPDD